MPIDASRSIWLVWIHFTGPFVIFLTPVFDRVVMIAAEIFTAMAALVYVESTMAQTTFWQFEW